jgi:hypothetical protein
LDGKPLELARLRPASPIASMNVELAAESVSEDEAMAFMHDAKG